MCRSYAIRHTHARYPLSGSFATTATATTAIATAAVRENVAFEKELSHPATDQSSTNLRRPRVAGRISARSYHAADTQLVRTRAHRRTQSARRTTYASNVPRASVHFLPFDPFYVHSIRTVRLISARVHPSPHADAQPERTVVPKLRRVHHLSDAIAEPPPSINLRAERGRNTRASGSRFLDDDRRASPAVTLGAVLLHAMRSLISRAALPCEDDFVGG